MTDPDPVPYRWGSGIEKKPMAWTWQARLRRGHVSELIGDPGVGQELRDAGAGGCDEPRPRILIPISSVKSQSRWVRAERMIHLQMEDLPRLRCGLEVAQRRLAERAYHRGR